MTVGGGVKSLAITTGLYRQVRWLSRRLRRAQLLSHVRQVEFYRSLVPQGCLCFDVGANIGEKSEAMLKAGLRVVAFEPNPLVLPELRARLEREKDWTLVVAAVGSQAAVLTLHAARDHGKTSLSTNIRQEIVARFHVPVITLDSAIAAFDQAFFCKIDVEGWETEVMRGLTRPLPLISFEFHLNDPGIADTLGCLAHLQALGQWSVNICPAESSYFFLPEWEPLERFAAWFPGDLATSLPVDTYGDIFVKHLAARLG